MSTFRLHSSSAVMPSELGQGSGYGGTGIKGCTREDSRPVIQNSNCDAAQDGMLKIAKNNGFG